MPVLALLGYLWIERRPPRTAISFPNLAVLASVAGRSGWRRHLVTGLLLGVVLLLCVAVARPRVPIAATSEQRNGRARGRRLLLDGRDGRGAEQARGGARGDHLVRRPCARSVKVGLVAFADDPVVVTAPTTDRQLLRAGIATLTPGFGTAIGDALARAVDLVKSSTGQTATAKPTGAARKGAVVLLSDGTQTHGVLAPNEGAHLAEQAGIPVYTIALGTLSGTVTIDRSGPRPSCPFPPIERRSRASRRRRAGRRSR